MGDGIRTRDIRNHNPTLYQLSYTHREKGEQSQFNIGSRRSRRGSTNYFSPACFQSSSTRRCTSGVMRITSGQGRVKPSSGHLRVASTPIFEP